MEKTAQKSAKERAEPEKAPPLLQQWQETITGQKDEYEERLKLVENNRQYAKGKANDDGKPGLVRTNLVYVNQAAIVPHTYAKDPDISVSPSEAIDPSRYQVVKSFAKTLNLVLTKMLVKDAKLKQRQRSNLYSVMTTSEGWLKMIYQRTKRDDPYIKARINDTQDNLLRIERLINQTDDESETKDIERKRDELKVMLDGLHANVEVVVAEGLAVDRVLTEDIRILDPTIVDFDYYVYAAAICHDIWMSKDEYIEIAGEWPDQGAPSLFNRRKLDNTANTSTPVNKTALQLVCVHEIWDHNSQTVFTFGEGAKVWARDPYQPENMPERWYPFYRLGWNFLDGSKDALSDVALQKDLNDEYNAARTQFAEHRKDSMPVRLVRASGQLTSDDINNINNRKSRDVIVISGSSDKPLQQDIGELPAVTLNPAIYDTSAIRSDMEMVSGRGDAAAGTVAKPKTLGEAEILQQGLTSRSDYRRDLMEDLLLEMAIAAAQMCLMELTPQQAEFIAGQGAVWPHMSKDEAFALVNIQIRPGSTGKPDRGKEKDSWLQLLPILQQAITGIAQARAAGQTEMAETLKKMTKVTLEKFDERLDLEDLLGPDDQQQGGQNGAAQAAQMQMQVQQLQQQLQECQAQLEKSGQDKIAAQQADQQIKQQEMQLRAAERMAAQQKADREAQERAMMEQMKEQEAERKAAEAQANHQAELEAKAQLEREKMDRQDSRAHNDRAHALQMKNYENELADMQRELERVQSERDNADTGDAKKGKDQEAKALSTVIDKLTKGMEAEAKQRQKMQDAVLAYLKSKKEVNHVAETA